MRIESIDQAEALFFQIASGEYEGEEPTLENLEFGDWAHLKVYLPKPPINSSITPAYMEAFLDIQKQIYQLAALSRTGLSNSVYLNEDDKRAFDIVVQVTGGSSIFNVELTDAIKNALAEASKKMTGKQLVTVVLGLGLLFSAGWGFSSYLEQQKELKLAEIKSSEHQGTLRALNFSSEKQIELLDRVLEIVRRNGPEGEKAVSVVKNGYDSLLKAASRTSESVINEQSIDQDEARTVRVSPRTKAEPEVVRKHVRIIDINTDDPINISVVIRTDDEDGDHRVKFSDTLFADRDREKMFAALRTRSPLWIELSIKRADNEIRSVEILRVVDSPT